MNLSSEFLASQGLVLMLQSAIVLTIGLLAAMAMKSKGPAWATMIFRATLATAFLAMLASPLIRTGSHSIVSVPAPASGPKISWPSGRVHTTETFKPSISGVKTQAMAPVEAPRIAEPSLQPAELPKTVSLRDFALAAWLTGSAALVLWIAFGQVWLWTRRRKSTGDAAAIAPILNSLAARHGVKAPDLVVCPDIKSPFLAGIFRPAIYVPDSMSAKFDADQIEAILSHELIHIRHRDCVWNLVAKLVCAASWPNPLSWILARQTKLASEELCDQAVIQLGLQPKSYAQCLLRVAELTAGTRTERYVGVGVIGFRSTLARRVELVLDSSKLSMTRLTRAAKIVTAGALSVVAASACLLVSAHRPAASLAVSAAGLPKTDPAAAEYLTQTLDTYSKLNSYSARVTAMVGEFDSTTFDLAYKRPSQAVLSIYDKHRMAVEAKVVSEKDRFFITSPVHPNSYVVHQRPASTAAAPYGQYPWYRNSSPLVAALDQVWVKAGFAERALEPTPNVFKYLPAQSITFGPDKHVDSHLIKTIVLESDAGYGTGNGVVNPATETTVVEIDDSDHLIRKETVTFAAPHRDDYVTTEIYSNVKTDIPEGTISFAPPASGQKFMAADGRSVQSQAAQALTSQLLDTLKTAQSISFVDDEIETQTRPDANGESKPHAQHMRMTVELEKPLKAHVKLTLDEYPQSKLELIADGKNLYVLQGDSPKVYVTMPATANDISRMGNVGIPINACQAAMDLLGVASPNGIGGTFEGEIGEGATFDGQPVDELVQKWGGRDRYGFPASGGGSRTFLISKNDHTLCQATETMGEAPKGATLVEKFSNFRLNPALSEDDFKFDPTGMAPVGAPHEAERHLPPIGLNMQLGDVPPDFHSTDFSGKPISLDQFKGKVIMLYGWTLGIGNYQWDLPHFQRLSDKYAKQGLVVIGIPYDGIEDKPEMLKFLKSHGITAPQVFDGLGRKAGIQKLYKTFETMFTYVIGRDGRLYAKDPWDKDIDKAVAEAMAK